MRSHDAIARLSAAAPALNIDTAEEERILDQILASPSPAGPRQAERRHFVLVVVGAAVIVAAIAAGASRIVIGPSHHAVRLGGPRIQLAGYHFKTPAGFKPSSVSCGTTTDFNGFAAAASADGGCLEAFVLMSSRGAAVPTGAEAVNVGAYHGYLVPAGGSQQTRLYVVLPALGGQWQSLVLLSEGLTPEQLVAIAESGLPQNPAAAATIGPT